MIRGLRENGEREVRVVGVDMSERSIGKHLCDAWRWCGSCSRARGSACSCAASRRTGAMASGVGVTTARIDMLAFALGSGIAGLAGCALSQIGNVGPDLGQGYIVDSFMVVVLGGVGQLAGTVYAALGLGVVNKLLEAVAGAVLAKIVVLVLHHRLHPEAAAGTVRDEGPGGGRVMATWREGSSAWRERLAAAMAGAGIGPARAASAPRTWAIVLGGFGCWSLLVPILQSRGAGGKRPARQRLLR